ncbi:hypothetical protein PHYSODRAFT_384899, partial [Phytophthora sojae]
MTVPQPVYEYIVPPKLENVRERCEWTGEDYKAVVRSVRSAIHPDMMTFLATYEIGKDKAQITDEDIMSKVKERCEITNRDYLANPSALFAQQLKMDMTVKDVPDRVSKYFRQFEKIIADNGFHENLGRGSPTDDDYIKGMLELVKFRHIRINDQLLYKLVLERAELQQLFYNRFRQA